MAVGRPISHCSSLGAFPLSRVVTCREGKEQLPPGAKSNIFFFSKVDYKSCTFIFVIFHLLMLVMRLVIIYTGSALTQALRSFLFISFFIFFFLGRRGQGGENTLAVLLEG